VIYSRLKRLKRVRTKRSGSNKIVFKNSEREEEKEGEASFGGDFDLMSAVLSAFLSPFLLFSLSFFFLSISRVRHRRRRRRRRRRV
jgi:hypothetical protein